MKKDRRTVDPLSREGLNQKVGSKKVGRKKSRMYGYSGALLSNSLTSLSICEISEQSALV